MANTFKNAGAQIGTARTVVYSCPPNAQAVIHSLFISNVDGTNDATVNIEITVDGGITYRHIGKSLPVPADSTLIIERSINLESNDILVVTASDYGDVEAVASILEIT